MVQDAFICLLHSFMNREQSACIRSRKSDKAFVIFLQYSQLRLGTETPMRYTLFGENEPEIFCATQWIFFEAKVHNWHASRIAVHDPVTGAQDDDDR
ncbi:predicted protein [Sclerotinia sclerotiorum 1980 UF-70]|uniref:Uncharacterized protein n=1 Tax=Sclerotinia sclerotiorum (strain ATCC 18683 / 1980 / Ss-1) TaxID=665079 RepID=A7F0R3_SCLS1|nr:predicted protein [Sclerotinia sclerotiorum 1980 UF-70]EDN95305.1 predicted protein [Sclerotinia sclerotiorum 1980 UF-70]